MVVYHISILKMTRTSRNMDKDVVSDAGAAVAKGAVIHVAEDALTTCMKAI
jgi:hypothetical protein